MCRLCEKLMECINLCNISAEIDSVKNPYMEDFSHHKFVPAAQSLRVTRKEG
jgi:hypothetical protein